MSNIVTYKIQLDVKKVASQLSFSICKGDTGRRLVIQLISDGKVFNLSKGNYAVFSATKPDGTVIYNDCTISNDVITYDITEQTVSSIGNVEGEITLYDSTGYVITAPKFSIIVYDSARARVDLESYNQLEALDQLMINEAARIEQEVLRVENEEQRGVHEAYRIASTYILRAYLNKLELPILSKAKDIFSAIDEGVATNNNRFFITNDGGITGIACLEYIPVEGDHIVSDPSIVTLVPNVVYRYRYVRFVCLNVALPETNVFEHLEETVKQYEDKAKEWADIAEDKVEEITGAENEKNGFVRLDSDAKIPTSLIPSLVVVNRQTYYAYDDTEEDINNYLVSLIRNGEAQPNDYVDIVKMVNVPSINDPDVFIEREVIQRSYVYIGSALVDRLSDAQILNGWKIIGTDYASFAAHSATSDKAYTTDRIQDVLFRIGNINEFNASDKKGVYIVSEYTTEELTNG